jgi:hypothetical protein
VRTSGSPLSSPIHPVRSPHTRCPLLMYKQPGPSDSTTQYSTVRTTSVGVERRQLFRSTLLTNSALVNKHATDVCDSPTDPAMIMRHHPRPICIFIFRGQSESIVQNGALRQIQHLLAPWGRRINQKSTTIPLLENQSNDRWRCSNKAHTTQGEFDKTCHGQ